MPKAALGKSHGQTLAWCVLSPPGPGAVLAECGCQALNPRHVPGQPFRRLPVRALTPPQDKVRFRCSCISCRCCTIAR